MARFMSLRPKWLTPLLADTAFALGLVLLAFIDLLARPQFFGGPGGGGGKHGPPPASVDIFIPQHSPTALTFGLVLLALLPLALRRRFPISVLGVVTAAAALYQLTPNPPTIVAIAPLIALYTVGTLKPRGLVLACAAGSAAVALAISLPSYDSATFWFDFARILAMYGVAAAIGDAIRNQRAYVAEVERRALEAEHSREEEARRRVDEERLRIARELHDVTAHSLSIIAVQSGVAAHVLDTNPAQAKAALEAIRETSKDALDELRAMLGVLRATGDPDAPLAPVPGLARLGELTAPLSDAGYDVTADVAPDLADVPAVVEFSAYRLVQEALTNVVRHAGICRVWIRIAREADALLVTVEDDGRTPPPAETTGGHGLAGMRERVAALGGTFEAGPRDAGGFRVAARLPFAERSRS
jgi:signal transduction histidine kinase